LPFIYGFWSNCNLLNTEIDLEDGALVGAGSGAIAGLVDGILGTIINLILRIGTQQQMNGRRTVYSYTCYLISIHSLWSNICGNKDCIRSNRSYNIH
jgi:hypothetical protein